MRLVMMILVAISLWANTVPQLNLPSIITASVGEQFAFNLNATDADGGSIGLLA
ncbi:MAG: hypothetical protein K6347_06130 [Campylobacterales bacterium]